MNPNDFTPDYTPDYACQKCAFICSKKSDWIRHVSTAKHIILTCITPDYTPDYACQKCAFICSKKSDWIRHVSTAKHMRLTITQNYAPDYANTYKCICGRVYKHMSSLCSHKKTCVDINTKASVTEESETEFIIQLLKQNQELQKSLIELSKEKSIVNNNSHNKTFNLQVFLNEDCKDAMNLSEFVSSIKVELSDLETTGRLGYVEGVTRIVNKNLSMLDVCKRPIHCSDSKRETLYIKNDNKWTKESEDKSVILKAIKHIANENIKQISEWRNKHPGCNEAVSRKNDTYLKIVSNAMSGSCREEQQENYGKIISNIAKSVVIVKH